MLVLEEWDRAERARRHHPGRGAGRGQHGRRLPHHGAVTPGQPARWPASSWPWPTPTWPQPTSGQINAHGTSTPLNDAAEAEAVAKVFGTPGPPMTSIKGVTGHALGGAGALEAAAVLLSFEKRLIPPTAGTTEVDPAITVRRRRRRAPAVGAGADDLEQLRLRRPQRDGDHRPARRDGRPSDSA